MSVQMMGAIWNLQLDHNELIVMLAMADHADHLGQNIFPSIGLIAWKSGYSERQVKRIINKLVKIGLLTKKPRPGKTTVYAIDLSAGILKQPYENTQDKMSPLNPGQNVTPPEPPRTPRSPTTQDSQESQEPSVNRQQEKDSAPTGAAPSPTAEGKSASRGTSDLATNDANNGKPMPPAPKKTAHEKRLVSDPLYAAAAEVWGSSADAFLGDLTAMLYGNSKRGDWKAANLNPPVEPDELRKWKIWYGQKTENATLPNIPRKVQFWIDQYRQTQQPVRTIGGTLDMSDVDPNDPQYDRIQTQRMKAIWGLE